MIDFMTAKKNDFKSLPRVDWKGTDEEFDGIIIIPEKTKHDSGFMCMSFAGCKGNKAVCLMGGGSDVIHFDGIGGYGDWRKGAGSDIPDKVEPKGWSVDCIPCGYLRIFSKGKITIGNMLSDFDIFATNNTK